MISLFFANIIGWIVANWRLVLSLLAVAIVLGLIGFGFSKCDRGPKLNEKQIQKNQDAVASGERKKMEDALIESRAAESAIDANRVEADTVKLNAINAARKEAQSMSNEQLAKTLEGLK